jgi:thioredoxin reductase
MVERSTAWTASAKFSTNLKGVFAAGDCRRGQSLLGAEEAHLTSEHSILMAV